MSEIKNVETVQEDFEALLEQSIKTLNTGDKVIGIVTGIGATEVQIDLLKIPLSGKIIRRRCQKRRL